MGLRSLPPFFLTCIVDKYQKLEPGTTFLSAKLPGSLSCLIPCRRMHTQRHNITTDQGCRNSFVYFVYLIIAAFGDFPVGKRA